MSEPDAPLTDADVARLVALADAAHNEHNSESEFPWLDLIDGLNDGHVIGLCECDEAYLKAANPATIKALAARLDALHAEVRKAELTAEGYADQSQAWRLNHDDMRDQRDAARAEVERLREQADPMLWAQMVEGMRQRDQWRRTAEQYKANFATAVDEQNTLRAERDALRDALQHLKKRLHGIRLDDKPITDVIEALLSGAGEPNE